MHFAGRTHVEDSFSEVMHFATDNILATISLFEAIRSTNQANPGQIKFVHVPTTSVTHSFQESLLFIRGCILLNSLRLT
jgi:dTDP-D-glucose 4,6-dehydratase